jgi:glucan 1,3-beta-glucosidase
MRVSAALTALATARLAAAAGQLGFALGVNQGSGACKVQGDYEADFDAIRENAGSTIVRVYSAADCDVVRQILPAAKNKGFQVILGVWYAPFSLQLSKQQ